MQVSLSVDVSGALAALSDIELRQVPYATSRALNALAAEVVQAEQHEMRDVFDRPKPYTLNALRVLRATKDKPEAVVADREPWGKAQVAASKYLHAQIHGGARREKRFEAALRLAGVLPQGYRVVPGEACPLDAYGNIPGSTIVKVLAYFRAFPEAGYKANSTATTRARLRRGSKSRYGQSFFVGRPGRAGTGGRAFGIWERVHGGLGVRVRPFLIFVRSTSYQATFDIEYVAELTVGRRGQAVFDRELQAALASARER